MNLRAWLTGTTIAVLLVLSVAGLGWIDLTVFDMWNWAIGLIVLISLGSIELSIANRGLAEVE